MPKQGNAYRLALYSAVAAIGMSHAAIADTVRTGPDNVKFDFELNDDPSARTCNFETLVLIVPDSVNFRLVFGFPKSREASFYAFRVATGNMRLRNGMPESLDPVPIATADITSENFNSAGLMQTAPGGDKDFLKATFDPNVARGLVASVTSGRFAISITRTSGVSRTYIIDKIPPREPIDQFNTCVGTFR